MNVAWFGSSLVSSYWNGAATYYRGIVRALADRGHHVTFYEPDAYGRQQHRDIDVPSWAEVVVWEPTSLRAIVEPSGKFTIPFCVKFMPPPEPVSETTDSPEALNIPSSGCAGMSRTVPPIELAP